MLLRGRCYNDTATRTQPRVPSLPFIFDRPSAEILSTINSNGETKVYLAFFQKHLIISSKDSLAEKVSAESISTREISFLQPFFSRTLRTPKIFCRTPKIFLTTDSNGQTMFQLAFCQKNLIKREFNFNWPLAKIFSTKDSQGLKTLSHRWDPFPPVGL